MSSEGADQQPDWPTFKCREPRIAQCIDIRQQCCSGCWTAHCRQQYQQCASSQHKLGGGGPAAGAQEVEHDDVATLVHCFSYIAQLPMPKLL